MNIESNLFKAYDIRGVYPSQINGDIAYAVGRAYATWLKKLDPEATIVAVGRDMRLSSPELHERLISGLTDSGLNVDDFGLVSTPGFYFGVAQGSYHGGLQVSASHNPAEYNGIKIVRKGAIPVGEKTGIYEIRDIVINDAYAPMGEHKGVVTQKPGVTEAAIQEFLTHVSVNSIKPLSIVIDAANAMGIVDCEALLPHVPCKVSKLNFELDGTFPAHEADPLKEENKKDLQAKVIAEGADLGIALDGDADRIFFVDEKGVSVEPAIVRGLLAQIELEKNPGATICYDIRPGRITRDMIEAAGGKPIMTSVGHSLIKAKMLEVGAIFGGESSGHFFYKFPFGTFEASMLVALKILEFVSKQNKPFSEILAPFRGKYFQTGEINIHVDNREKINEAITKVKEAFKDGEQNEMDGLYVEYPDAWFIIRASNTEPLMRMIVEAKSPELVEAYKQKLLGLVK